VADALNVARVYAPRGRAIIQLMNKNDANKKPALLHEDGAILVASIAKLDEGCFRASCHATVDNKSHVLTESPEYQLCKSETEAHQWVHGVARARGFPTIHWDRQ
jgi:hypothetical protein